MHFPPEAGREIIVTDPEMATTAMSWCFSNFPRLYFRLSVDRGALGITCHEWEMLGYLPSLSRHYLNDNIIQAISRLPGVGA